MNIFPAIDLYNGCAVRLIKGDYNQMTVYSNNPVSVAKSFAKDGAKYLHVVDLEGARDGTTANFETIKKIVQESNLLVEVGGGIRTEEIIEKYINIGVMRVILGTAAVTKPRFVADMVKKYDDKIAVGVDVKNGMVAIKGWTEVSEQNCFEFCSMLNDIGVKTVICTDISKDGVLAGTNIELYRELSKHFSMDIIASGGISSIDDVKILKNMNLYGAILGKAIYTKNIDLKQAILQSKEG